MKHGAIGKDDWFVYMRLAEMGPHGRRKLVNEVARFVGGDDAANKIIDRLLERGEFELEAYKLYPQGNYHALVGARLKAQAEVENRRCAGTSKVKGKKK